MSIWGAPTVPPSFVVRPRLTAELDGDSPLVVLYAPAGYGKTVALAHWAARTTRDGVWLRIREPGTSASELVTLLTEALIDAGEFTSDDPIVLARDGGGTDDAWYSAARLLRRRGRPIVLVVDQVDLLADSALPGLIELVAEVPDLALRLSSRRSTLLNEPALIARLDACVVGSTTLALTREEVSEVLDVPPGSPLVDDTLRAGGVPLVARALRSAPPGDRSRGDGVTLDQVVDSLILARMTQSAWDRVFIDFLLAISVADVVTVELAERLSGRGDAGSLLERASDEGLGMWGGADERLFGLSPHWRARLEAALTRERPDDVPALRARVAAWAREHRQPYTALRLAKTDGNWDLASEVVRESWYTLVQGHGEQVRLLFADVSPFALRRYPLIAMLLAIIYNAIDASRLVAVEYFTVSAVGSRARQGRLSAGDRVLLRTVESVSMRLVGNIVAARRAADAAYEQLATMTRPDTIEPGSNLATVLNHLGITFFYSGRTSRALDCFRRSAALLSTGVIDGVIGQGLLAAALAIAGDLPEARAAVAIARATVWPEGWMTGYEGAMYQLAEALIALEEDDIERAERHLSLLDRHRNTIEHWSLLSWAESIVLLARRTPERALRQLEKVEREQRDRRAASSFQVSRMALSRSVAALAAGDLGAANRALTAVRGEPVRLAVARARIALAAGEPVRALTVLGAVSPAAAQSARSDAEYQSLRAAAVALTGGTDIAPLERLVALLDDRGQSLALALVPEVGLRALAELAGRHGDARLQDRVSRALDRGLVTARLHRPQLTPRERVVAAELARSGTTAAIAAALSVSENTVKSQLRTLYRKLGVSTRVDALRAIAEGDLLNEAGRLPPRE
ncbi:MAG: LuxR C-terminal-related transcriptional regulator [Microbacteriaceae bacterium]